MRHLNTRPSDTSASPSMLGCRVGGLSGTQRQGCSLQIFKKPNLYPVVRIKPDQSITKHTV